MKITYEVLSHEGDQVRVRITPQSPLNGFFGCELAIIRNEGESVESFVEDRVRWKVAQQVGDASGNCTIEKA
jgi:hypothetical protein